MKKIVVIDDNELHLKLIEKIFDGTTVEVVVLSDVTKSLEYFEKETADLLILDIMLPKMSGVDLFKKLKSLPNQKNMKIIALTAQPKYNEKTFLDLGFDGFVQKPIKSKLFLKYIMSFLKD